MTLLKTCALIASLLIAGACVGDECIQPLRAGPGSDTAAALASAIDTLQRSEGSANDDDHRWVATGFARRAGDTVEVVASPRCWRGTDASGATVLLVPPARVVWVFVQIGG
jgi:hypothetical protein